MNVLITLPKKLIDSIISGEKNIEMRKCKPKHLTIGEDGFFIVEKGTDIIRCWCRVDEITYTYIDYFSATWFAHRLCVSVEYVDKYANGDKVYLWYIGKVIVLNDICRDSLFVDKNPQQFAYCPLSYGQSY